MPTHRLSAAGLVVTALLAGCGPLFRSGSEAEGAGGSHSVRYEGGAVVLTGAALTDGSGSVLATMAGKVPNLRVRRPPSGCPEISLRSFVTFESVHNPHVYVDGTRATNTCILDSINTQDVVRVEVYPQGYTTRPGYASHAAGLILVFMRGG